MAAGRKSKYQTHVEPKLFLVECWARDGCTDEQIAKKLGVAYSTFREYIALYPALSAFLKKGKEVIDFEVENALLKRALGYDYCEEKVEIEQNAGGRTISKKVVQTVKQVAPDVGAAAFWLKNRRPDKWRDRFTADPPATDTEDDGLFDAIREAVKNRR